MAKNIENIDVINFSKLPADQPEDIVRDGLALLPAISRQNRPEDRALIRYRIGIARIVRGEFEEAFRSLSEARQIHEEIDNVHGSLQDQLAIGIIYGLSEQTEAAFEAFVSIRDRAREVDMKSVEEAAVCNLGRICREQGRLDEGEEFLKAAEKLVEQTGHKGHQAAILHELGQIDLKRGRIEAAGERLEKAAEFAAESHSAFAYEYRIAVGEYLTLSGRNTEALELLNECLERCIESGIIHGEIQARFFLGNLYAKTGDIGKSTESWQACYDLTGSLHIRRYRILSGENLVARYREQGLHLEALALLDSIRQEEREARNERLQHTISAYDQSMRIDDLEREMRAWRRRSGELERIRNDREESIRELETIKEVGQQITSTLEPDTIVLMLHDRLSQMVNVDSMLIGFYEEGSGDVDLRYIIEKGERLEPSLSNVRNGKGISAWVINNEEDLLINSRDEFPEGAENIVHLRHSGLINNSFMFVRLRIEGRTIGLLSVQSVEKDAYKLRHLKVLQALAGFVAIALANSNAHQSLVLANEKIAHMATHDPLTGLPNRMQILNRLGHELHRCRRYKKALAVLFIDLDGFKSVNDSHGHKAGDAVLMEVADRLSVGIRATDAVGRLAGDEFLVILTDNCTPENGRYISEQIRRSLTTEIEFEGIDLRITGSIGLAFYPDDGESPEDLVNAADQAMYDAKSMGKNRIAFHGPSP